MKILMLTWEYPPRVVGGISRVVYDLSRTLLKDGHDVTVVTYRDGDAPYFEDDKGVKVYRVDNYMINPNNFIDWVMQLNFAMVAKVNEIMLKEGNFDVIIHSANPNPSKNNKDKLDKMIHDSEICFMNFYRINMSCVFINS